MSTPPTPQEICVGYLRCPPTPHVRVCCVPVFRRVVFLTDGRRLVTPAERPPVLEYEWCGDRWSYRGYR